MAFLWPTGGKAGCCAIVGISDTQTLTNKTFDISLNTCKTASNTAGHVPRNNGTQYLDAQLGFSDLSGNISTSQMNSGTGPSFSTFWRGDGTWAAPTATSEATMVNPLSLLGNNTACSSTTTGSCVTYIFANAHTLTRLVVVTSTAPSGCSVNAVYGVRDNTSSTTLASATPTSTGVLDSGALSVSMPATHQIEIGVLTTASGCTQNVTSNLSATYQ